MKPKKKKPIIKACDTLVSKIVRSLGFCEKCGRSGDQYKLEAAHIFGRRMKSVRWHFPNLLCLCSMCHREGHENPTEFTEWLLKHRGEEEVAKVRKKAYKIKQYSIQDLEKLKKHLKTKLDRIGPLQQ